MKDKTSKKAHIKKIEDLLLIKESVLLSLEEPYEGIDFHYNSWRFKVMYYISTSNFGNLIEKEFTNSLQRTPSKESVLNTANLLLMIKNEFIQVQLDATSKFLKSNSRD